MTPDGLFLLAVFGAALLISGLSTRSRVLIGGLLIAFVLFIAWADQAQAPSPAKATKEVYASCLSQPKPTATKSA